MVLPRAARTQRRTRIQEEKEELILEAALDVFATHGFRGSTIDQIAEVAGMSKPNLLYYFRTKEAMHRALIDRVLDSWLDPLREFDAEGNPVSEIRSYIRRKLEMARDFPRESRLFANEILQGAPHIEDELKGPLKTLVDEKAEVIRAWAKAGKIAKCDPYHLIFAIWSTTQHYADFDVQVRGVLGEERSGDGRFEDAARFLEQLFVSGLEIKEESAPLEPAAMRRAVRSACLSGACLASIMILDLRCILNDQCFERARAAANGNLVAFPVIDRQPGIAHDIGGNGQLRIVFLGKPFQSACGVDRVADGGER